MKRQLPKILIIVIWGMLCWAFFQFRYAYHFFYQEQEGLFLLSWEYVGRYFDKPAWLACLVGDFLTQFYYYMYAGAVILTVVLLTLGDLMRRALEQVFYANSWKVVYERIAFTLAIILMTIVMIMSFDEHFRLATIIGLIGGASLFLLHSFILNRGRGLVLCTTGRAISDIVLTVLAYWMFGVGALLFCILEIVTVLFSLACEKRNKLPLSLSIVPVAIYLSIVLWLAPKYYNLIAKDAITYPGLGRVGAPDYEFERVLAFDNEYYFKNYDKILEMAKAEENNMNEEMKFFYCMTLAKKDMLADVFPSMKNPNLGTFYEIGPETPRFTIRMIDELYYLIGDMTYTERAALLANTFSRFGHSARKLKRLAEANLVRGDESAAMKYLRILEKTIAYRQWAQNHIPGSQTEAVKAEIADKRQYVNTKNNVRIGDDCYAILTQLLDSNPKNTIALDYLLCSDMLSHQRDVFVRDYEKYGPRNKGKFEAIYREAK